MISLVLHLGMTGPSVARVQALLKEKGFPSTDEAGLFGPSTEEAVRAFQTASKMRPDGTVSREVWQALEAKPDVEDAAVKAMRAASAASQQAPAPAQAEATAAPAPVQAPTAMVPYQAPAPARPSGFTLGKALLYGGLGLLAYAAYKSFQTPPLDFGTYEDDYGLPPASPDDDDSSDETELSGTGSPVDTGIVPFGGGPALKRGPGGKFLPRGGKRLMLGS